MDLFPLFNSLRIATIATCIVFFAGIFIAFYTSKMPSAIKGVLDAVFTLPLVLPPTVVGFLLLKIFGPKSCIGAIFIELFDFSLTMNWWSAVIATVVVVFPLMYRTARGAFQSFDNNLSDVGKTLGLSDIYIFWKIILPNCKQGIIAGTVLSFARALGEYGATSMMAGYIPGKTATISTTVYQLWSTSNDTLAFKWVVLNILVSLFVLFVISYFENTNKYKEASHVSGS